MGHRWAQNVADYGLGGLGATIASRVLSGTGAGWIMMNDHAVSGNLAALLPAFPHLPYQIARIPGVVGHPHFPYGREVEPDAPV